MKNPYETKQYLNEYFLFHYGKPSEISPFPFVPKEALSFHRRVIECIRPINFKMPTYGLDMGCAVGRQTFELARVVDRAVGIDYSRSFIAATRKFAKKGSIRIRVKEEGEIFSERTILLPKEFRKRKVSFEVGDAQDLRKFSKGSFHVVLAINLIDRIPQPRKFLERVGDLIVSGGQLVIGSPYTWSEDYAPRKNWVGGYKRGKVYWTSEEVKSILQPKFKFQASRDLPFLIREHRRKYQWVVSEVMTFVRR